MKVMLLSSAINNGSFNPNATYSNANGIKVDDVEINGEHKAGWFACRYDGHSSTRLLEEPLITDDEVLEFDINVADVCNELHIAYCG